MFIHSRKTTHEIEAAADDAHEIEAAATTAQVETPAEAISRNFNQSPTSPSTQNTQGGIDQRP